MLPDLAAPANCPICASAPSHDAPKVGTLQGRVYQCGAVVCNLNEGEWEVTLYCEKTGEMLDGLRTEVSRLRADNVRLGDRNVLLATELQAIADTAERELGEWLPVVIERTPTYYHFARTVYDLATEALASEPSPSAAPGVALDEPAKAVPVLSVTADCGRSGKVS